MNIKETTPNPIPSRTFNISLTEKELEVLFTVVRNVSGTTSGPREVTDAISKFCEKADIRCFMSASTSMASIRLHDTWEQYHNSPKEW